LDGRTRMAIDNEIYPPAVSCVRSLNCKDYILFGKSEVDNTLPAPPGSSLYDLRVTITEPLNIFTKYLFNSIFK